MAWQYQLAVFDAGVSVEASVKLTDRVAGCVGEVPASERFRGGCGVRGIGVLFEEPVSGSRFKVVESGFELPAT